MLHARTNNQSEVAEAVAVTTTQTIATPSNSRNLLISSVKNYFLHICIKTTTNSISLLSNVLSDVRTLKDTTYARMWRSISSLLSSSPFRRRRRRPLCCRCSCCWCCRSCCCSWCCCCCCRVIRISPSSGSVPVLRSCQFGKRSAHQRGQFSPSLGTSRHTHGERIIQTHLGDGRTV